MIRQATNPTDELDRLIAWDRMWSEPRENIHVSDYERTLNAMRTDEPTGGTVAQSDRSDKEGIEYGSEREEADFCKEAVEDACVREAEHL